MQELLQHVLSPFIEAPEDVQIDIQESPSSQIITITLDDADLARLEAEDGAPIHSIRHIMSIASGAKKAIIRLESLSGQADEAESAEAEESE